MTKPWLFTAFLLFLFSAHAGTFSLCAQEISDKELEQIKKQKEYAEARQAIAEAEAAELAAKFPAPDADALKGNSSVDGSLIESRIQAYKAMEKISDQISSALTGGGIQRLYVYRESDYAKVASYKRIHQQIRIINGEYAKCFPPGVGPAGAPPVGVLASLFLNWLPLLKTETTTVGAEFDIEDEAVLASLAPRLRAKGVELSNPFVSNFDFVGLGGVSGTGLLSEMEKAEYHLNIPNCSNAGYGSKLLIDKSFRKLKERLGVGSPPPTPETSKTTTQTTTAPPTVTVVETIEKSAATSSPEANPSIWDHLQTEAIIAYMQANQIYWLKVKNSKSGGNVRIKSNPLIDIFRGGNTVKFSGGSVGYYYVFDNDGKIVFSSVLNGYVPYTKSSRIK